MSTLRILLVDDHALVREALRERFQREPSLDVVATASTADEAVKQALVHKPDIVVMDIDMPGRICFDAARTIMARMPETHLIFLSAHTNDHYIEEALSVGALGYLTKGEPPERVVKAILSVGAGIACYSEEVLSRIVIDSHGMRLAPTGKVRVSTLSPRETEVLRYIARGLTKKEIASIMHVSVKTVEKHTDNLMAKLDIHDRVNLSRFAIRENLVNA